MSSTVVTPVPKSSAPATPLVKEAPPLPPSAPQTVPFPPPQTFDIVPPLHGLLLRLLSPPASAEGVTNGARGAEDAGAASGAISGQAQSQQQQSANNGGNAGILGAGSGPVSASAEMTALGSGLPPPLDIKDLPTEVSSIKIRIQKAHAVVESLPDIHRSVIEQEKEIQELEDRIAKLKSVISDFGKRANGEKSQKLKTTG